MTLRLIPQTLFGRLLTALLATIGVSLLIVVALLLNERRTILSPGRELAFKVDLIMSTVDMLADLDAEQFTRDVLVGRFGVRQLVVGYDHGFGRGRAGDVELLRRIGARDGFEVAAVDAVQDGGRPISSTLIRAAVAHGDLAAAERLLGRPYSTRGVVEPGQGRGRTLGIPTINLAALDPRKLLPPDGVYAVRVEWRRVRYGGMMNQGARPTFGVAERALEIHLFDFDEELYGEAVTVEWVRRLRDTQTFPSRDALVAQLTRDARAAQDSLKP